MKQVGRHERVGVGDKGSRFGEDRGLGGLGGGLECEGGPHLPPVAVRVQGGGGTPADQLVEGAEEQGQLVVAVHLDLIYHSTSTILEYQLLSYSEE